LLSCKRRIGDLEDELERIKEEAINLKEKMMKEFETRMKPF